MQQQAESAIDTLYKMSPTPLSGASDCAVMPPWCRRWPHYSAGKRCQLALLCCSSNPRSCKRRGCIGTVQQPHPPCRPCLHSHTQGLMLSNGPAFSSNTPALTWCSNKAFHFSLNGLPLSFAVLNWGRDAMSCLETVCICQQTHTESHHLKPIHAGTSSTAATLCCSRSTHSQHLREAAAVMIKTVSAMQANKLTTRFCRGSRVMSAHNALTTLTMLGD